MRRREFVGLLGGAAAWPVVASAQQSAMPIVGFLHMGLRGRTAPRIAGFRQGLRSVGFIEGKNIGIEFRAAQAAEHFPSLAAELVGLKVHVIVAVGWKAVLAAQAATQTIPIVMSGDGDPIGVGFSERSVRPGGNITGFSLLKPDLSAERFRLLRDVVPSISPVMVLWSPMDPLASISFKEVEDQAQARSIKIQSAPVRDPEQIDSAFHSALLARPKTLLVASSPLIEFRAARIAELALDNRLPSISYFAEFAKAGGLMSYGLNSYELSRQSALYVGKLLAGAKPAELPLQQPHDFEFVINLDTAKALDVNIPPAMLAHVDFTIGSNVAPPKPSPRIK